MIKRTLKNKAGITLLEGVIALGLLAMACAATFGVLLATSRKTGQPDIREEMIWAVERASDQLQAFIGLDAEHLPDGLRNGICGDDPDPLSFGEHDLKCMLPAICDWQNSHFKYSVDAKDLSDRITDDVLPPADRVEGAGTNLLARTISFNIRCNGFTL